LDRWVEREFSSYAAIPPSLQHRASPAGFERRHPLSMAWRLPHPAAPMKIRAGEGLLFRRRIVSSKKSNEKSRFFSKV
jgi:hypothetical protein